MNCWCVLLRYIGTGGLECKVSWEYAAGILLNCTFGGIVLTDETVWSVLFQTLKTTMTSQHELTDQTLTFLCGVACNLSLMYKNNVYFEQFRGRDLVIQIDKIKIGSALCCHYVKQTIQNLEKHRRRLRNSA